MIFKIHPTSTFILMTLVAEIRSSHAGYCNWGPQGTGASSVCNGEIQGGDWCNVDKNQCENGCGGKVRHCERFLDFSRAYRMWRTNINTCQNQNSGVPTLKVLVQRLRYPLDLPRRDPIWPPRQDIGIVQEGHVDARLFPMVDQTRHLFTATPMPCLPHPKAISIMQSSTELRQSALRSEEVIGCPKVVANVGKSLVRAMHSGMKEWKVLLY